MAMARRQAAKKGQRISPEVEGWTKSDLGNLDQISLKADSSGIASQPSDLIEVMGAKVRQFFMFVFLQTNCVAVDM
jgi:hypothetical protein